MDIKDLWEQYYFLLIRTFDVSEQNVVKCMLDELGERMIMTPANMTTKKIGCEPGGMLKVSLQVASQAIKLLEAYGLDPSMKRNLIKVALLYDLGKVGDLQYDHFIVQDSDWHREKLNAHYKISNDPDLQKMAIAHRTLYLLQHFGIALTQDEWLAIQLASGFHFEENRWYVYNEPTLARIIQHAIYMVIRNG
jgi:hypothetical protein